MIDEERLIAEKSILERNFPSNCYRFLDMNTNSPYIVLAAKTDHGNLYTLRIDLELFPENRPNMYVVNNLDMDRNKTFLNSNSPIHTIECEKGMMLSDYIGSWSPMTSIYNVYYRGKMWLEMYENQ